MDASFLIGPFFIIIGATLKFFPPEQINNSLGYRSPSAMRNKDTWLEGNRFFGKTLLISGIGFELFLILINFAFGNNSILLVKLTISGLLTVVVISILCTEVHLKKMFNKNDVRKWCI